MPAPYGAVVIHWTCVFRYIFITSLSWFRYAFERWYFSVFADELLVQHSARMQMSFWRNWFCLPGTRLVWKWWIPTLFAISNVLNEHEARLAISQLLAGICLYILIARCALYIIKTRSFSSQSLTSFTFSLTSGTRPAFPWRHFASHQRERARRSKRGKDTRDGEMEVKEVGKTKRR